MLLGSQHVLKGRNVVLLLDEMHVRDDLVYDKHSGKIISFANLGEVNNHLSQYEESFQGDMAAGSQVAKTVTVQKVCYTTLYIIAYIPIYAAI